MKLAVAKFSSNALKVRLNSAIDPKDAYAIDVQYHFNCWAHHVGNAFRGKGDSVNAVNQSGN